MSGIAPKQNAFKFKIAPHKQKSIVKFIWQGDEASLTNEALCLSTPKHNGKCGTVHSTISYYGALVLPGKSEDSTKFRNPEFDHYSTFLWSAYGHTPHTQ
jgi:hypothetical protein